LFQLLRVSGPPLGLTREHDLVAAPRKGSVDWGGFDRSSYAPEVLTSAARVWRTRAEQEMHSLALFTELASQLQTLGAPLDWSGAFSRMIADEVRHTDLCMRMAAMLGDEEPVTLDERQLRLFEGPPSRPRVREVIVAAFCIGETVSGRMFEESYRVATVPLARDVVRAILVDEAFHSELGWELGALLMRPDGEAFESERSALAAALPRLFRHYRHLCLAEPGKTWEFASRAVDDGPNFGALTEAGYARAFYEAMETEVVPGLVAIGLPEAEASYATMLAESPS